MGLFDQLGVVAAQPGASPWVVVIVLGLTTAESVLSLLAAETVLVAVAATASGFLAGVVVETVGRRVGLRERETVGRSDARGAAADRATPAE